MATNYTDQLIDGMDVYDVNGDKIGSVDDVYDASAGEKSSSGGGYLRVPTGFLGLGREHHIPFSAIRSVEGDRINLRVSRDDLDNLGYGESPTTLGDDRAEYVSTERTSASASAVGGSDLAADDTPRQPRGDSERRLQLREEELIPRKRAVQTGEVRLQTDVVQEQRTVDVPVTREEVYVERRPVERRASDRPISDTAETIKVPVTEEEVTVEKRPVVYEEVEVGKRAVQETEAVDATVRREELRVQDEGNVLQGAGQSRRSGVPSGTSASTSGTSGWAAVMPGYRSRWQERYGSQGGRWEDVEPAYQYGYGLRQQAQYRGKSWTDIEPDVRRDWSASHPNTAWDRASLAIRDTWENVTDR
jgi:uncharacterized protein (TIGR02271 family)